MNRSIYILQLKIEKKIAIDTFKLLRNESNWRNATQKACSAKQTGWSWDRTQSNTESSKIPSPWANQVSLLKRQIGAGDPTPSISTFEDVLLEDLDGLANKIL